MTAQLPVEFRSLATMSEALERFWDWLDRHGCFTIRSTCELDQYERVGSEGLLKALDRLLYSANSDVYGVHLRKSEGPHDTPYLHDPRELLACQLYSTNGHGLPDGFVAIYKMGDLSEPPKAANSVTCVAFRRKYPDAVDLI